MNRLTQTHFLYHMHVKATDSEIDFFTNPKRPMFALSRLKLKGVGVGVGGGLYSEINSVERRKFLGITCTTLLCNHSLFKMAPSVTKVVKFKVKT